MYNYIRKITYEYGFLTAGVTKTIMSCLCGQVVVVFLFTKDNNMLKKLQYKFTNITSVKHIW